MKNEKREKRKRVKVAIEKKEKNREKTYPGIIKCNFIFIGKSLGN